jgi:N-acetylmuramoyl-L-alanine amidase
VPSAFRKAFRIFGLVGGLFLLHALASGAEAASTLLAMRLGVTAERTRLVLEFRSAAFSYKMSAIGDSLLILRMSGVQAASSFAPQSSGEGLFLGCSVVQEKGPVTVLRLRMRTPSKAQAFRVARGNGRPDRLVVDIRRVPGRPGPSPGQPKLVAQPESAPSEAGSEAPAGRVEEVVAPPVAGQDSVPTPDGRGPRIVVIDAGHGGEDPGATAKGLREKDVCIDVATRLKARLDRMPGVQASLTRSGDVRIPLRERLHIAEKQNADLFVSIHVNAARSRAAQGVEVFFLSIGAASDEASQQLARLENEADPDYVINEDESLKNLPFMVNLRQSDTLLRSSRAAEDVLDRLTSRKLALTRGVKQAGFAVLKSFQVPSVLVEVGFISSVADRNNLKTPAHRENLAEALADGIHHYLEVYAPQRASADSR